MRIMNKKILVLGAGGFIGKNLVDKLLNMGCQNIELAGFGVDVLNDKLHVKISNGEINRALLDSCNTPDVIFHLIGGASVGASVANPMQDFELTIPPLLDVINKIGSDWPSAKLIFVSSAAVYGSAATISTRTDSELLPASPYGLHKKMAEEILQFYANQYSFKYSIVRPFSVYGPGLRKQLLWDALNKAGRKDASFFGTGEEERDWIFVDDLVSFLIEVADPAVEMPCIINAGTGLAIPVNKILQDLFALACLDVVPVFIDKSKKGDPSHLVSDKQEQSAYSNFFNTPLNIGLKKYINWYNQEVK